MNDYWYIVATFGFLGLGLLTAAIIIISKIIDPDLVELIASIISMAIFVGGLFGLMWHQQKHNSSPNGNTLKSWENDN